MDALNRQLATRETPVANFLPYTRHVTRHIIELGDAGSYLAIVKLQGVAHATADPDDVNYWHLSLAQWMHSIASPNVALQTYIVGRTVLDYPEGVFAPGFNSDLAAAYREHIEAQHLTGTDLYLSIIYTPVASASLRFVGALVPRTEEALVNAQLDAIAAVDDILYSAASGLARFGPELLSCYDAEYGDKTIPCSDMLAFLGYLANGVWREIAVPERDIRDMITTSRPHFGDGSLMSLAPPGAPLQYCALLAIKEYPSKSFPGMLDNMLGLPGEFIISQSFVPIGRAKALRAMKMQGGRMTAAGDVAVSQREALKDAMDDVASNRIHMGDYEMTILLRAASIERLDALVAAAGTALDSSRITWLREDISMGSACFALFPGNFGYRVSPAMISNLNFAALSALHAHPTGYKSGNQYGECVMRFGTTKNSKYDFSFHERRNALELDIDDYANANTLLVGRSGGGKTMLAMTLAAALQQYRFPGQPMTTAIFDKDQGAGPFVRAQGKDAVYYALKNGVPSGCAPCQQPINESTLEMLGVLIRRCIARATPWSPREEKAIDEAILGVMNENIPKEKRSFSAILQFFDHTDDNGVYGHLARWCRGGPLGWLFDNPVDTLSVDHAIVGIDETDFLKNDEVRPVLTYYLLHRLTELMDGRRFPIIVDEAPNLLGDDIFVDFFNQKIVTVRKLNSFFLFLAQNPRQILGSPIGTILVSQCPTHIYLSDPTANRHEFVDGMHCTVAEWNIIRTMGERQILIKQNGNSVVVNFDLGAFPQARAILAGNVITSALAQRLADKHGGDPAKWLPEFHSIRKGLSK